MKTAPAKPAAKAAAKAPAAKSSAKITPKAEAKPTPKVAAKPAEKHPEKQAEKSVVKIDAKSKPSAAAKPAEPVATAPVDPKAARKGITIVAPKPMKKAMPKPAAHTLIPPSVGRLLDPKNPIRRPLIPSGPKAANVRPLGSQVERDAAPELPKAKTPFNKKELDYYRTKLLRKRAELAGDVSTMESEALRGESGSLSNLPQHMAEQGSEAYDQSLSLDLAAADRKMIREIDEALVRIANGTYGICTVTGTPIGLERLEEIPWAALSIEAARALERPMGRA